MWNINFNFGVTFGKEEPSTYIHESSSLVEREPEPTYVEENKRRPAGFSAEKS